MTDSIDQELFDRETEKLRATLRMMTFAFLLAHSKTCATCEITLRETGKFDSTCPDTRAIVGEAILKTKCQPA
jgi:hypothetical protein